MRVVLDTNVLVSALIRPQGPPGQVLDRVFRGTNLRLVASPATLQELRRTLGYRRLRKYLAMTSEGTELWVDALQAIAIVVEDRAIAPVIAADPADDIYLATAAEGLADYIVSGDRHLLDLFAYEGIPIVTPRRFLDSLDR